MLDTHVFLWWVDFPQSMSREARDAISNGGSSVFVSAAVAWEIAIKKSLGKLEVPDDIAEVMLANRFLLLPVTIEHAMATNFLPYHHRDPFDRLLIAQAIHEGLTFVSRDAHVANYEVSRIVA